MTIYEAPPTSWNRSARGRSTPPSGWSDRNRTSARALQLYCSHSAGFEHVAAVTSGYRFHRVIIFRVCTAFIGIHPPHLWSAQCPMMTEARPWLRPLLQDSLSAEDAAQAIYWPTSKVMQLCTEDLLLFNIQTNWWNLQWTKVRLSKRGKLYTLFLNKVGLAYFTPTYFNPIADKILMAFIVSEFSAIYKFN